MIAVRYWKTGTVHLVPKLGGWTLCGRKAALLGKPWPEVTDLPRMFFAGCGS